MSGVGIGEALYYLDEHKRKLKHPEECFNLGCRRKARVGAAYCSEAHEFKGALEGAEPGSPLMFEQMHARKAAHLDECFSLRCTSKRAQGDAYCEECLAEHKKADDMGRMMAEAFTAELQRISNTKKKQETV